MTPPLEPSPQTEATQEGAERSVRLADQLDRIAGLIQHYCLLPHPDLAMLLAVWIANSYTFECFDYCGYLHIQSATPACGKTTLLKVLHYLCTGKPPILTAPTAAVIFRSGEKVLLIDEAERLRDHDKENFGTLLAVLNAGIEREGGQVKRLYKTRGENFIPETFPVYGPKALAGIADITDTLESRSFHIQMQRAAERPPRLRGRTFEREASPIRERLTQCAQTNEAVLKDAYDRLVAQPDGLEGLSGYGDRFQDLAEPLVILASVADVERPEGPAILSRLLAGLSVVGQRRAPSGREHDIMTFLAVVESRLNGADSVFVPSQELADLCKDTPGLTHLASTNALADLLKPFNVVPRSNGTCRGYDLRRQWVNELKKRYSRSTQHPELTPTDGSTGGIQCR
jgi:putative DNA primase/helicase